jgi:hypothetical protein
MPNDPQQNYTQHIPIFILMKQNTTKLSIMTLSIADKKSLSTMALNKMILSILILDVYAYAECL